MRVIITYLVLAVLMFFCALTVNHPVVSAAGYIMAGMWLNGCLNALIERRR